MATVAGFLFLGIGLVSARAARRRLSYDTWYHLHFYTYLAIALAFSHQFADGASFVSSLKARFVWSLLYASVAALLLWYRVISPLRSSARHRFHVVAVAASRPDVVSVYIGGQHLDELQADPGQFFRWRFLTRGMWWSSHPYSLSAAPRPDVMRITVKDRGDHSGALAGSGPAPGSSPRDRTGRSPRAGTGRRVLLLAGGVGITPLRAMFATLPGRGHPHLPGQQPARMSCSAPSWTPSPGPRGHRALPDRVADPARRRSAVAPAAAVLVPGLRRARRLRVRAGRHDRPPRSARCARPASRGRTSTTSRSSSERTGAPMRRVVLAVRGTVAGLVTLLSFRPTSRPPRWRPDRRFRRYLGLRPRRRPRRPHAAGRPKASRGASRRGR